MFNNIYFKIIISVIVLLSIFVYMYYTNNFVKLTNYKIIDSKLPQSFNGYKILHISDFHNYVYGKDNIRVINKVKEATPDIIVITGDLIDAHKTNMEISLKFVKEILNIAPVYYVPGNHEAHNLNRYDLFSGYLDNLGVNIIAGKSETIEKDGSEINIVGLLEQSFYKNDERKHSEIAYDDLSLINYNKDNYTILLNHRPELFDVYVENNINLVFCGHAHGGQWRIPFVGGLYSPNQGLFPKYTVGVYNKNNTNMVVSRGVGNSSSMSLRINNMPEVILVELYNK